MPGLCLCLHIKLSCQAACVVWFCVIAPGFRVLPSCFCLHTSVQTWPRACVMMGRGRVWLAQEVSNLITCAPNLEHLGLRVRDAAPLALLTSLTALTALKLIVESDAATLRACVHRIALLTRLRALDLGVWAEIRPSLLRPLTALTNLTSVCIRGVRSLEWAAQNKVNSCGCDGAGLELDEHSRLVFLPPHSRLHVTAFLVFAVQTASFSLLIACVMCSQHCSVTNNCLLCLHACRLALASFQMSASS